MADRELTAGEERFIEELELDRELFLGARLDTHQVQRRDPYFIVERATLSPDQPVLAQIHGLEMSNNLRFGNHMIAISHLLVLVQKLGIRRVFLLEHPLFRRSFAIHVVLFTQSHPAPHHTTLRGLFFYQATFRELFKDNPKPIEIFHLFRVALLPLSGDGALNGVKVKMSLWLRSFMKRLRRELTIHIRSGDIFLSETPHPAYWQPPLDFYTTIITKESPRKVTLVFEDTANPVIPALVEWLRSIGIRYHLEDGPIEAAILELATARHVVGGKGSFLTPILAISRSVKLITAFSDQSYLHLPRIRDLCAVKKETMRVNVVPAGEYETLVSPWTNSPEQRDNMLRYVLSPTQQAALRPG